jgi:DNA invertase Pin-like site-specific DNA recombinase
VKSPHSIDRQVDKMLSWCKSRWSEEEKPTIVIVEELVSGFKEFQTREEGKRIIANMQKGDFLITCKYARGWRNSRDFHNTVAECERRGVTIIVIDESFDTSTAIGKFMVSLSVALAQLERDQTSERMREFHHHRRRQGRASGAGVPFGSMVTICQKTGHKIIVDNEDELRVAKWVWEMKYVKKVDWYSIAATAKQLGIVGRSGNAFSVTYLRKVGMRAAALKKAGKI